MLRHVLFYLILFHNLGPKLVSVPKWEVCMFLLGKCIPLLKLQLSFSGELETLLSRTYTLLKKNSSYISRGIFRSLGELSVLSHWICSIYHLQLYGKPTPLQMLLLSVRRLFKIVGKSPVVESKVTGEILYQHQHQYQHAYQHQFRKAAHLEISRTSFLTSVADLQSTGCKAAAIEFITKFLENFFQ